MHCSSPNLRIFCYHMYATYKSYPIHLIVITLCNIIEQTIYSLFSALKLHTETPILIMKTLINNFLAIKSHNILFLV